MRAIGRFAPTPSGPLHYGSLASYCHARAGNGTWLLRIEDVDTPRVVAGAADRILRDLEAFAFEWDGSVSYQSQRFDFYREHLEQLLASGACYACECSRRSLREQGVASGPLGQIYPGNCRGRKLAVKERSIRLNTADAGRIGFTDAVYGDFAMELPREVGDFVLRRVDGIYAYHLAVVVDDELQGIDQIVRGADLLENTCLHLFLQRRLGFRHPDYLHLPLVNNAQGVKLSKQTGAHGIDPDNAPQLLFAALNHLGQQPDPALKSASPGEILGWSVENWNPASIPARRPASAESLQD